MKYSKILFVCAAVLYGLSAFAQTAAKKPSLMVVPSRQWCVEHDCMMTFGETAMPDYRKAFDTNPELNIAVAKIGQMMSDRGFDLKMMSNALATIQAEAAEDMLLTSSTTGAEIEESPIDKLKKVAKADIWLEVSWILNSAGFGGKSLTFNLSGIDAYTDMQIANCQGTGDPSYTTELPVLMEAAVASYLDNFNEQLLNHFNDWFENGRHITLYIKKFADSEYNLESEFNGEELGVLIEDWVAANTVRGQFNTDDATENFMKFSGVRIPMFNESGRAVDARYWGRGLQKKLRELGVESKVMTKGLGQVTLVIGGK